MEKQWQSCICNGCLFHSITFHIMTHSVQFSHSGCSTLCNPTDCSTPGFPVNHQLPKLAQTHVHPVDDAIQPSHSLLSPSLTAFNLIQHQGSFQMSQFFTLGGQSTRVSASNECLSNEYSGLISLRTDWFNHLAVQGTLTCLLQYHSSKASILWHSAFFTVQLSHPCMTTGKTITLTRCTFVGKVTSLLFNMLSRLVMAFLPRSKHLNFMAAVTICSDSGAPQNKVCHCFHCFPIYLP